MRHTLKNNGGHVKIGNLFEVYKKRLRAPEGSVVSSCIEVVHDVLGISLTKNDISYTPHSRTLTFRARGPLKAELLMHREDILGHLRGRLGVEHAPHTIL